MRYLLSVAFVATASLAQSQGVPLHIECVAHSGETVSIDLFGPSEFGPLHCIQAPGIYDLTPCAPDQGWGLSFGTGAATLSGVTTDVAVASAHPDGKFAVSVDADFIIAAASIGPGLPDMGSVGNETFWRLAIGRVGMVGVLQSVLGPLLLTCTQAGG